MQIKELKQIGKEKDIILFGTGKCAEDFFEKYKNTFSFLKCYDNGEKKEFHGLKVMKPQRKPMTMKKKELIIICSMYEKEIEEQLTFLGYTVFEDFINVRWFEYFTEDFDANKETVFFYGTCHTNAVMNAMRLVPEFYSKYNSICIRVNTKELLDIYLAEILLLQCNILVYQQYVGNLVDKRADITAKKISFPFIKFWAYWPQTDMKEQNVFWKSELRLIQDEYQDNMLARADTYINSMIFQNKSEDEILSYIMSEGVISREKAVQKAKKNFSSIKVAEKSSSIKIYDYFLNNYQKFRVYYEYNHLGDLLIREYAGRILLHMGIKEYSFDSEQECYPYSEIPIYPCIADYLGLEMIDSETKYRVRKVDGTCFALSFEEYEREYIRRCKRIMSQNSL